MRMHKLGKTVVALGKIINQFRIGMTTQGTGVLDVRFPGHGASRPILYTTIIYVVTRSLIVTVHFPTVSTNAIHKIVTHGNLVLCLGITTDGASHCGIAAFGARMGFIIGNLILTGVLTDSFGHRFIGR